MVTHQPALLPDLTAPCWVAWHNGKPMGCTLTAETVCELDPAAVERITNAELARWQDQGWTIELVGWADADRLMQEVWGR